MKGLRFFVGLAMGAWCFSSGAIAHAMDISGTPTSTIVIFEDSQLVGDVDCTQVAPGKACIQFGADHITLRLNGFTITGNADPTLGCGSNSTKSASGGEDGIDTAGHSYLQVLGSGLVRNFRGIGVNVTGGAKVKVSKVTTTGNCICGIGLFSTSSTSDDGNDNDVEDNVVVRTGKNNSPCGGMNISTNKNRVRRNIVGGNGYYPVWLSTTSTSLNFGIKIAGNENLVEENVALGNANGILLTLLSSTATSTGAGNVLRRNILTGNPTLQDSESFGTGGVQPSGLQAGGFDILNLSPNANTFDDNLCLTSNLSGICPNIPKFSGHKNGDEGGKDSDHHESR